MVKIFKSIHYKFLLKCYMIKIWWEMLRYRMLGIDFHENYIWIRLHELFKRRADGKRQKR